MVALPEVVDNPASTFLMEPKMGRSPGEIADMLAHAATRATQHVQGRNDGAVVGAIDAIEIKRKIDAYDLENGAPVHQVVDGLYDLLASHSVRIDSPRYFGLFNPAPLPEAIVGEFIAAAVNPQLAVWNHAPAALELERAVMRFIGERVGWEPSEIAGTFTSGGSEANSIALMAALAVRFPNWRERGVASIEGTPVILVSSEAHLAWLKIARAAGLGSDAVRLLEPRDRLALNRQEVETALQSGNSSIPVLIVATAGATAHGAIDNLEGIAAVARENKVHFHVDAAWAGAALLSDSARRHLAGIHMADSITIDPHKWLSVPMGAGLYLSRSWDALREAFSVTTGFMPSASDTYRDPYLYTPQWSRRSIGLALFTALASIGRGGYARYIDRMIALGELLKNRLCETGWVVINDTPLPVACFTPQVPGGYGQRVVRAVADSLESNGDIWISVTQVKGQLALRACITSYQTTEADLDYLILELSIARAAELIKLSCEVVQ